VAAAAALGQQATAAILGLRQVAEVVEQFLEERQHNLQTLH
jgi:hypothetical protein